MSVWPLVVNRFVLVQGLGYFHFKRILFQFRSCWQIMTKNDETKIKTMNHCQNHNCWRKLRVKPCSISQNNYLLMQKCKFCPDLLIIMLLQTCMTFFSKEKKAILFVNNVLVAFFFVHVMWIGTGLLSLKKNVTKVIRMTCNVNSLRMNQTWVASQKQSVRSWVGWSGSWILTQWFDHNDSSVNSVLVGKISLCLCCIWFQKTFIITHKSYGSF